MMIDTTTLLYYVKRMCLTRVLFRSLLSEIRLLCEFLRTWCSKKRSKRRFVKIVLVFRNNFTSARAREHTYTRFHKKRDRFASPQKRTRRYLLNGFRERLVTLCVRIIVAFFLVLKLESLFPRQQRVVFGRLQRYLKRHSEI